MNRRLIVSVLAGIALAGLLAGGISGLRAQSGAAQSPAAGAAVKPAEEVFKNIQILKGVQSDQILPAMQFISASLGVECEFCHVKDVFEKDDKPNKATARKMMQMQMSINKDNFKGRPQVTCYSCHRGANEPVGTPIISDEEPKPAAAAAAPGGDANAAPKITADQLLEKFVQALGGAEAIQKVMSRVEKGTIGIGSRQFPIEVFAKAPDKRISIVQTPNGQSITAFDGHAGWLGNTGRPTRDMSAAENEAARLNADFYFAAHVKQVLRELRVGRPEKIGDRTANVLLGRREGQPPVKLYFDPDSGLLVRLVRYTETPLGRNPAQIDFADYRDSGGVKIPFRWTLAQPNGRFTIQVEQVQQNVPIDDAKFAKPPAPPEPKPSTP